MVLPPELRSEAFTRWWPHLVGVFGMFVIVTDAFVFPPPEPLTMTAGTGCIIGFGAVKYVRNEKAHDE